MDEFPVKLATVKTLNRFISPVIKLKGKPIQEYSVLNKNIDGLSVCDHGTIGADELMLMDILGTLATHGVYNNDSKSGMDFSKRIPTSSDYFVRQKSGSSIPPKMIPHLIHRFDKQDSHVIPEFYYKMQKESLILEDGMTYTMQPPRSLTFNDLDLFKKLPLLKKKLKTPRRLFELIKKTSDCKLRMFFPFVLFEDGKYKKHQFVNRNCSSSLFRFRIKSSETASNGNILSRKYQIAFDTILGFFFMQNVLSCHTSLLPGHFYNMSEYAQLFYRMLILPYYNGVKIPISLKEIKARLVLKSDNSMSRKIVKRRLEELEDNRFISNREEIQKKDGSYWYQYKKNDWGAMTKGD
jgi:hypothetical protein